MSRRTVALSLAAVAAAALTGCGARETVADVPDVPGVSITSDTGDTRTVKSDDGMMTATGTKGAVNARFPAYAPAYPGATIQTSVDMDIGPMKQHTIVMLTQDSEDAVLSFYEAEAKAAGLKVTRVTNETGGLLTIGNSPLEGAVLSTMTTPAGTSISLAMMEK